MEFLSLIGTLAMGMMLLILARLSRRLGHITHAKRYYWGQYIGSLCLFVGAGVDFWGRINPNAMPTGLWVLLAKGLPAIGFTLGLIATWYYWSWLLAERN